MNYDRGNKKWQSLFLVEHKRKLKNLKEKMNKIEKPDLSDQQKEKLDMILFKAKKEKKSIKVEYFKDGIIRDFSGIIGGIDKGNRKIEIKNGREKLVLDVFNIVNLIEK
ncbi:MAG: YolD-like family protein [Bacillota bacterium]